jgi:fructose-1,6-bisphosphatase I
MGSTLIRHRAAGTPLADHVLGEGAALRAPAAELESLLAQVGSAAKVIAAALRRAGLAALSGVTGEVNVQGEAVKKFDVFANEAFIDAFRRIGLVCALVSEELEAPFLFVEDCSRHDYVLFIDPLDGSSNLDVNGPVGSIFSIHRRTSAGRRIDASDLLRHGVPQVAAGYVAYGPSTILVYAAGHGVHAFTLDPSGGDFLLSHPDIRIPSRGKTYSVNEGRSGFWAPAMRRFIESLKVNDPAAGRPYSARYSGALVADLHRTLLEGGVYLYPAETAGSAKPAGKLRLMYEAAPLAFVAEQAGGRASTGTRRILEITPENVHQRVPLIIGSPYEVSLAEEFMQTERGEEP